MQFALHRVLISESDINQSSLVRKTVCRIGDKSSIFCYPTSNSARAKMELQNCRRPTGWQHLSAACTVDVSKSDSQMTTTAHQHMGFWISTQLTNLLDQLLDGCLHELRCCRFIGPINLGLFYLKLTSFQLVQFDPIIFTVRGKLHRKNRWKTMSTSGLEFLSYC